MAAAAAGWMRPTSCPETTTTGRGFAHSADLRFARQKRAVRKLPRSESEIANRQQRLQRVAAGGERLAASFEAVDDRHDAANFQPMCLGFLNGRQRAAAGGDDVFDDHNRIAFLNGPFNVATGAVLLRLLAH